MTPQELRKLLRKTEGLKLDFKREYKLQAKAPTGVDQQLWKKFVDGQWDELIKDILAITNGNFGTLKESGFLVIGVDDKLTSDGTRQLYDTSYLGITRQQILSKVNKACNPPIRDLNCEYIELDDHKICVISIPHSPFVHETTRPLETVKGYLDSNGKFTLDTKSVKMYTTHTAFIRRGEDIFPATNDERRKLEEEKNTLTNPIRASQQTPQNGRTTIPEPSKLPKSGTKPSKLPVKDQVREKLRIDVLEPLQKMYDVLRVGVLIQIVWIILGILLVIAALGDFPPEMTVILLIPSLVLLAYFGLQYLGLKGSANESGFYSKLTLTKQRDEMRADIRNMANIRQGLLDKYLYKGYIAMFLYLILPSKIK